MEKTRDEASAVNTTTARTRRIGHKAAKHNNKGGTDTNSIIVELEKCLEEALFFSLPREQNPQFL